MTMPVASFRLARLVSCPAIAAALFFAALPGADAQSDGAMMGMPGMHHDASVPSFRFGEPGRADKVDRTVTITMKDISFEPANLEVKTGETIRFVLVNTSETDHDFTIGDADEQAAHRKEMAEMMEKGGEMHHDADPNALSVKAGQSGQLIWKFTRPGRFEFDCNIPGHYEAGMKGDIVVTGMAGMP